MASAGTVSFFKLDSAAGSLTDFAAYIDDITVPTSIAQLDVSTMGTQSMSFIPGLIGGDQITIKGPYAAAVALHLGSLVSAQSAGSTHSFLYGPGGSVSGQAKLSGETLVASYTPAASVGGRVEWSASLQITGAVTAASF